MTFQKWLDNFGLLEEKEKKEGIEDVEAMKKKSLQIAEKIIGLDKQRKQ